MPSQKNSVSRFRIGRSTNASPGSGGASFGLNFSTRNSIEATRSLCPSGWQAYQVFRDVTKYPSPIAVCFGPTTESSAVVTRSCSPTRRYRS